ncbi:hypothetical protein [Acetivibrio cellulolyticus]|uniref:hypothetical protein n=1 Tax=Acetivibrio cellulolyticus TaxID=35830 RepID=UPI0001E2F561|nr:hypothetical protein [Acetivibrio cellulolyticus]
MGLLREIFGPSRKEIWQVLSEQMGSEYIEGGFFSGDKVVAHVKEWIVTMDTYTVSTGKSSVTYTRIRAPYVNKDGFRFKIYRSGAFSEIGAFLGMQDVEVGFEEFDREFVIKGNDEQKLKDLFLNTQIRSLIEIQPRFHLEVKDDEGWFGAGFPDGVDELYFLVPGVIKDIDLLKALFEVYSEILNQLCIIGSAYESDPGVTLK